MNKENNQSAEPLFFPLLDVAESQGRCDGIHSVTVSSHWFYRGSEKMQEHKCFGFQSS